MSTEDSRSMYLIMCEVLEQNHEITTLAQLGGKMCELGYEDAHVTQGDIEMAFGYIAQFREVDAPIWENQAEASEDHAQGQH